VDATTEALASLLPPWIRIRLAADASPTQSTTPNGSGAVSTTGPNAAPCVTIVVRRPSVVPELLQRPSIDRFASAYIEGDLDVEGDLLAAVSALYALESGGIPLEAIDAAVAASAVTVSQEASPRPVAREDDATAVKHHYDRSNEFFALFLDPRMVYTCAYYPRDDASLEEAQEAKLELVCRKLRLAPGDRMLDLGCGWGGLVAHASRSHGASALGVTLSTAQAEFAAATLDRLGLGEAEASVRRAHWQEVEGHGCFDKVAAVGMIEHVGVARHRALFDRVFGLLRPGGLFLNHGITHPSPGHYSTGMEFLTREIFPGAEFERVSRIASTLEDAGFEIVDVEALGGHYARTTADWLARLTANAARARELVGERTLRAWSGYLAAASVAFRAGWIDLHQVLARKPDRSAPRTAERRPLAPAK